MDEEPLIPENDSVFMDFSELGENISSDALHDDSFASVLGPLTSTPIRQRGRGRGRQAAGDDRSNEKRRRVMGGCLSTEVPPSTSSVTAGRLPCTQCSNTYASERTLAVHKKMHVMKAVSSRAASLDDLKEELQRLFDASLNDIPKEKDIGVLAAKVRSYCLVVKNLIQEDPAILTDLFHSLSLSFYDILESQNALFPSAIRSAVHVGTNKLLSCPTFIEEITCHLKGMHDCTDEICNAFIGSLMLQLSGKVIVFYLKKMRLVGREEVEIINKKYKDEAASQSFQELVYHIGGSIVSGFLWRGRKFHSSSKRWAVFLSVMKCRFLAIEGQDNACSESVRLFTESKDRGGLKYISQQAFDFFLCLFDIVMSQEQADGSLPMDKIEDTVLKSDGLLCLWDVVVGIDLTEEQALDLLLQICKCATRIVAKGVMKRRLNEEVKKAFSSVSLRSRLAR